MRQNFTVGVFDSGIGGLNVLAACQRLAPEYTYYYLGDNEHAPYGSKPCGEIYARVRAAIIEFERLGVDAVVLGCNTATAVCANALREEFSFPIVGTEPAVALAARKYSRPLVLCTPRTAESARLNALIQRFPQCSFTVAPMPRLAGEIERSILSGRTPTIADHLPRGDFDAVVLGCTHYAFVRRQIATFYGVETLSGEEGTAKRLVSLLAFKQIECEKGCLGTADHQNNDNKHEQKFVLLRGICAKNVIFLGNSGEKNKQIYKQMFVL
ncbi:MAG: aspartate/glutamate racemase family protein [Clostridiales bacterium]|nr:aspartate/glutamate racemase family protein [Clostridiales bacterium]